MRFFGEVETSKSNCFSINYDSGLKLFSVFSETYTKKIGYVMFPSFANILIIFGACCFSKICKFIVVPVSVNVVDICGRPFPMHDYPRQSMSSVLSALNADINVSVWSSGSNDIASLVDTSISSCNGAGKNSCFWTIVQKFTDSFCRNICRIFDSHDAPPVRWDQRRGRVDSACLALSC